MIVVVFILGLVIGLISSNVYERRKKKEENIRKVEPTPKIEEKSKVE
jgi:hypothetical protein